MTTPKQMVFASLFVFALLTTAAAQDNSTAQRSSLTITASAADDRVRITAPSSVVQMRVEVYAASGEKLFDQEIRGGNVFDWHLQDGQAQRLAPGNYVCVITAKSVNGRLTQKIGTVTVEEKSVSVQPADSPKLSAAQAQTIGPVEENSSWTIPGTDELQTPTVIANDGTDGQMIRGRGALTFRIGNFFSGIDKEQMRLTEDGRLGIGTSEPKAKLDVAGTIRAQRFLVAKPNTPASDLKAQATDAADSVQPLVAGTGTQDRIAKWTDNAGTLGDSSITEIAGNVGIGTTTPGSKLVVSANSATLPPASGVARFADADGGQTAVFADAFGNNAIFNVRRANGTAASPSALQANQLIGVIGASGYGASAYMGTRARVAFWASEMWTDSANGTYLTFNTTANGAATPGGTERMRIDNAGNVGIGTTPFMKLDVAGNINTSTQYNIGYSKVVSIPGDSNTFVGVAAGQENTGGARNAFFGNLTGQGNTLGSFNSYFGMGAGRHNFSFNQTGSGNSFFGYFAGDGNITGNNNAALGREATVGSSDLTSATAIGAFAQVDLSNSLVLGSIAGINGAAASTNVGIGTTAPVTRLDVRGGYMTLDPGSNPVLFTSASAGEQNRYLLLINSPPSPSASGLKAGGILVADSYDYANPGKNDLVVKGRIKVGDLGIGGDLSLCRNPGNEIAVCGLSSLRYKTNIRPYTLGLELIARLNPISFNWRQDGRADLGLGAEDVAKVAPSFTFTNSKGEIEGVKYDRLNIILINAVKQQQEEISRQQSAIDLLTTANAGLSARLRVVERRLRPKARSARSVI